MKLEQCKTCKGAVAASAQACPHCGDNRAARNSWWWVLGILTSAVVLAILAGLTSSPT